MIIRSQGRGKLVNFNKITNIWVNEPYSIKSVLNADTGKFEEEEFRYEIYADDIMLGQYKSVGRAKQVLDEIEELYEYCNRMQEGNAISLRSGNTYVYQMPEK